MDHGVARDAVVEIVLLRFGRQFAVEKEVADLQEVAVFCQLIDRISAVKQDAFVAIDEGDLGFTGGCGGETRVVRECARILVKRADIDHIRPNSAFAHR